MLALSTCVIVLMTLISFVFAFRVFLQWIWASLGHGTSQQKLLQTIYRSIFSLGDCLVLG